MTSMVEGSFEDAVRTASSRVECFEFLNHGFKRMRIAFEWNNDSPKSIIHRVDEMHARLVEEASNRMRKIPEERMKKGLKGYMVVQNVIDLVAKDVLRRYHDVAVDLCSRGPDVEDSLEPKDHDWYKWFRFCVFETDVMDNPDVRPHILRSVTIWDEEIIQKIIDSYPRVFFETHPEKWNAICRTNIGVLRSVRNEKDILLHALKCYHYGSVVAFNYMKHLAEDRAFMSEAILIDPHLLDETPLKNDNEFVLQVVSCVKDDICAYNNILPWNPWQKTKYLCLAIHAVQLNLEATWDFSQDVVEAALRCLPTLLVDEPKLMDRKYRRVVVNAVELHWNSLKNMLRDKPLLCSNAKFLKLLIERMASREENPFRYRNIHSVYTFKPYAFNPFMRNHLFNATETIFMDMMKNLLASRECHHMCEEAMDGLNDDAVKKIVRARPVLVKFIKNSDILEDNTFIMPLLEAEPDIYYLLSSTHLEMPPYTRLRWGVYNWMDMECAFKRWRASESMCDLFFYETHSHLLWDIWCPTLLQLKLLPVDIIKHIMSFLMFGPGVGWWNHMLFHATATVTM